MRLSLSEQLKQYLERAGLSVSRVSSQVGIPKQTLLNWCGGRSPRWHSQLPNDLQRLSRALGLSSEETDELLLAAGCVFAIDSPHFEEADGVCLVPPKDWFCAGSHPKQYAMGLAPNSEQEGGTSVLLCSRGPRVEGFGTLMQTCRVGEFLGKRVRLSAMTRSEGIEEWAGLWFRVDGQRSGESLAFDNMQDRALTGTNDWFRHSIVLDVAMEAKRLAYGALLSGLGRLWVSDVRIEVVGDDVPSTSTWSSRSEDLDEPTNLDFGD